MKTILRKTLLTCLLLGSLGMMIAWAQAQPKGINYQAVARDKAGQLMVNQQLTLRISLVSPNKAGKAYYTELHEVTTDDLGQVNLVIGEGKQAVGEFAAIPWSREQLWLDVEMATKGSGVFDLASHSKLLAVPYAKQAATTSRLAEQSKPGEEKNQSIYWLTSGNSLTQPPTHFLGTRDNKDLVIKTNNTTRMTITAGGQMRVDSGVDGEDTDKNAYPMTIEGSKQGIFITVTGKRNGDNNFVTFADEASGSIWGRIEGQTLDELKADWEYQLTIRQFILSTVSLAANVAAFIAKAIGEGASIFAGAAAVGAAANAAALLAQSIALGVEWGVWQSNTEGEVGVTYQSGAGDYAEWLERAEGVRDLHFGEVVGVRGGKISLNTDEADDFLVISQRPAVAGNMPQPSEEKRFEQVAFMGQVPVKVAGPVTVGDYILPSGNHDGFGVAIHPKEMKTGDFDHIIGVAWEASKPDALFSYVNTAVGINANDLSAKVNALNNKVEHILAYLEGKAPLELPEGESFTATNVQNKPHTVFEKAFTDEEFDQVIDRYAYIFDGIYDQIKAKLERQGYDLSGNPQLAALFNDPIPVIKALRRDPYYLTQWSFIDQQVKRKN